MSVTIDSDLERDIEEKLEPCLCAQGAEGWSDFYEGRDTPEIRYNLKQQADPKCSWCKGVGIEVVAHEIGVPSLNLSNRNAEVLFNILGVNPFTENGFIGAMTISEARRAIMRAQSRDNLDRFILPERREYGKPTERTPGVVDMKPLRIYESGLTEEKIQAYIKRFADFVIEVSRRGATKIVWY